MDRKKKIEYLIISICIIPIFLGTYLDNKTLMAIGSVPLFLYIGILVFDIIVAMGRSPTSVRGKISNIINRRNKLGWKDFELKLEDGTIKKFSIPELEFPNSVLENDYIEVSFKKTGVIGYVYVTKMRRLLPDF